MNLYNSTKSSELVFCRNSDVSIMIKIKRESVLEHGSMFRGNSNCRRFAVALCSAGFMTGSFVYGQTNAELLAELRALKGRVAELEAQQTPSPSAPASNMIAMPTPVATAANPDILLAAGHGDNFVTMARKDATASSLNLYGFARLDAVYDSNQAGLDELLGWATSSDVAGSGEDDFYLYPKLTRVGANLDGPTLASFGGAKLDAKLEVDFYKEYNGSDSRNALRMRHAYAKLQWDQFYILAGQTADTISPLYPAINPDMIGWGLGNLGDRRPQLIAGYTPSMGDTNFKFIGSVGESGAVSSQEGDDNANFQGLIGMSTPFNGSRFSLDVWGHYADEDGFDSEAYGLSVVVPLYQDILTLQGELWTGTNMDDIRGGIFQGVVGGDTLDSTGGFAELNWKVNKTLSFHGGYAVDDPDNDQLFAGTGSGSRARNETYYVGARFNFDPVQLGIDFIHTDTEFLGAADGDLDRIQTFLQYNF